MNLNRLHLIDKIKKGLTLKYFYIVHENSKDCLDLLNILWDEGYIFGFVLIEKKKKLKVFLKYYSAKRKPVVAKIKSLSKPSIHKYFTVKQLWKNKSIKGQILVSSHKGLFFDHTCKKNKIGGKILLTIK